MDGGTPYGNAADEPNLPDFPEGSLLGTPDLVLRFAESYTHIGNNKDEYRYFVLPTELIENRTVKAIELRPGNSKIVHHALFFNDTEGLAATHDALTPEYGFNAYSGFDVSRVLLYEQYPGYVPGQKPRYFPESMGQTMVANSDLVIQMHYAPYPTAEKDSSTVNVFLAPKEETIDRVVSSTIMLPFHLVTGPTSFFILPNEKKTFLGRWVTSEDLSLLGLFPHMHYLGRDWEVWIERPDGSRQNMIKIDDWDFDWQGGYFFPKFIIAPKGSIIYARATYDNTTSNYRNPNNPPKFVTWGENTTDEMYYLPLLHVPYKQGDEHVVFDQTTSAEDLNLSFEKSRIFSIYPNPSAEGLIHVGFELLQGQPCRIEVFDLQGRLVKRIRDHEFFGVGKHVVHVSSIDLNSGTYILQITGSKTQMNERFIVIKP